MSLKLLMPQILIFVTALTSQYIKLLLYMIASHKCFTNQYSISANFTQCVYIVCRFNAAFRNKYNAFWHQPSKIYTVIYINLKGFQITIIYSDNPCICLYSLFHLLVIVSFNKAG